MEDIRWVVIAYVLTYASLMLIFGKLGDLVGYTPHLPARAAGERRGLHRLLAGADLRPGAARPHLQGVGIALTLSCGPALATSLFDETRAHRVLGVYAGVIAIGSALGPLVGGVLVERWGWSAVFWFRVPMVLAALALSARAARCEARLVRRLRCRRGGHARHLDERAAAAFAVPGPVSAFAAPGGLAGWSRASPSRLSTSAQDAPPRADHQAVAFRDIDFAVMNGVSVAVNLAAFSVLLLVPYYLVRVAGLDAAVGGAVLALGAVGTIIGAWLGPAAPARARVGQVTLAGIAISVGGFGTVSTWTPTQGRPQWGCRCWLPGRRRGLFQVAYTDLVVATLPLDDRGVAGSLTMVTRTLRRGRRRHRPVGGLPPLRGRGPRVRRPVPRRPSSPASDDLPRVAAGLAVCLALSLSRAAPLARPGQRDANETAIPVAIPARSARTRDALPMP